MISIIKNGITLFQELHSYVLGLLLEYFLTKNNGRIKGKYDTKENNITSKKL